MGNTLGWLDAATKPNCSGSFVRAAFFFKITKKRKMDQIQTVTFLPVLISESTDFEIQGLCIQYTRVFKLGIQYLLPEIK